MSKKLLKALKKELGDEKGAQMYLDIVERGEEQTPLPAETPTPETPPVENETPTPPPAKTDTPIDKEQNVIINVNNADPVNKTQSDADIVNDFFKNGGI